VADFVDASGRLVAGESNVGVVGEQSKEGVTCIEGALKVLDGDLATSSSVMSWTVHV